MAAILPSEENHKYPTYGSCNGVPESYGIDPHCSLDVLPVVVEEASDPTAEKCCNNSLHGLVDHEVSVLSVQGINSPSCAPQLALLSFLEFPVPPGSQMNLDHPANKQNLIDLQVGGTDAYSSCVVDIDIGIENFGKVKPEVEAFGTTKSEGIVTGMLQRQSSLKACGKFMEIVTNHGSPLLNLISRGTEVAIESLSISQKSHSTREPRRHRIIDGENASARPRLIQEKLSSSSQSCRALGH